MKRELFKTNVPPMHGYKRDPNGYGMQSVVYNGLLNFGCDCGSPDFNRDEGYELAKEDKQPIGVYIHQLSSNSYRLHMAQVKLNKHSVSFYNPNSHNSLGIVVTDLGCEDFVMQTGKLFDKSYNTTVSNDPIYDAFGLARVSKHGDAAAKKRFHTLKDDQFMHGVENGAVVTTSWLDPFCCGTQFLHLDIQGRPSGKELTKAILRSIIRRVEYLHGNHGLVIIHGLRGAIVQKLLATEVFTWVGESKYDKGILLLKFNGSSMDHFEIH